MRTNFLDFYAHSLVFRMPSEYSQNNCNLHLLSLLNESTKYLENSFISWDSYKQCKTAVTNTVELFHKLDFKIHSEKSTEKKPEYLGFIINSKEMTA